MLKLLLLLLLLLLGQMFLLLFLVRARTRGPNLARGGEPLSRMVVSMLGADAACRVLRRGSSTVMAVIEEFIKEKQPELLKVRPTGHGCCVQTCPTLQSRCPEHTFLPLTQDYTVCPAVTWLERRAGGHGGREGEGEGGRGGGGRAPEQEEEDVREGDEDEENWTFQTAVAL
eukprot:3364707-Rhodomonas_salina.1